MNLSTSPHREIDWTVTISVHEREGQTQATARLLFGDHESVGVGLSRLSPAEHGFAGLAPPGPEATSSVGSRAPADSDRNQRPDRPG